MGGGGVGEVKGAGRAALSLCGVMYCVVLHVAQVRGAAVPLPAQLMMMN